MKMSVYGVALHLQSYTSETENETTFMSQYDFFLNSPPSFCVVCLIHQTLLQLLAAFA